MRNIRKCNIDCKELDWKHKTAPCNGILWRPRRAIRVFTRSKGGRKRGWGQVGGEVLVRRWGCTTRTSRSVVSWCERGWVLLSIESDSKSENRYRGQTLQARCWPQCVKLKLQSVHANETRTVKLGVTMDIKKEIDRIRRNCCPAGKFKYITFIIFFHWTTCLLVFLRGVYLSLFMCLFGWICCKWARRGILLAQRMIGFYWAPKLTLTSSLTPYNATSTIPYYIIP